jgi:molybdopterin synthase catalytic subunit
MQGVTMTEDWIEILPTPLDASAAIARVQSPQAGGIDVFLGTTRAESRADGTLLVALDYEAYGEMALKRMKELAAEARKQWPIVRLAMLHRTGRVALAEPSVIIAVATPHRAESFATCRWLIDALKKDVPIWKREIWADREGDWVHP